MPEFSASSMHTSNMHCTHAPCSAPGCPARRHASCRAAASAAAAAPRARWQPVAVAARARRYAAAPAQTPRCAAPARAAPPCVAAGPGPLQSSICLLLMCLAHSARLLPGTIQTASKPTRRRFLGGSSPDPAPWMMWHQPHRTTLRHAPVPDKGATGRNHGGRGTGRSTGCQFGTGANITAR